ncbi:sugar ABC transporter permease [Eubacteriales bacterium OttesenSCG-928-A19]|nr:sugar ABC transporter permease [Eubacteriales bacterium OttesenSCG-928-A19]
MNRRRENLVGYAFIAPALLAFLILIAFPFFASMALSFTSWNFLGGWSKLKWVGLDNFTAIARDMRFLQAVKNTFIYAIATVPTSIAMALGLAYLLNGNIYFRKSLRMAFFIPYISSAVALSAVFKFMFRDDGIINALLSALGMANPPQWFASLTLNKVPIIMLVIWTAIGYELIIYMSALQNVPKALYEAAEIDGASSFQRFRKITFPLVSPTTFYLVIVRLIATFKMFSSINIMTLGSAAYTNTAMVVEIYANAFGAYKFGYAAAESMVLFVMILVITLFNFWGQKKWVHY